MIYENSVFPRVQNIQEGFPHFFSTVKMWRCYFRYPNTKLVHTAFWCMLSGIK